MLQMRWSKCQQRIHDFEGVSRGIGWHGYVRYGVPVSRALELLGRRSTLKAGLFLHGFKVLSWPPLIRSRARLDNICWELQEFLKDNVEHFCMDAGSVKALWSIKGAAVIHLLQKLPCTSGCVMQKQPSNNTTVTTLGGFVGTFFQLRENINIYKNNLEMLRTDEHRWRSLTTKTDTV